MFEIVFSAALSLAGAAGSEGPCTLASAGEVEQVLGGAPVPLGPDEIGEETAPSCQWATAKRDARVKLALWSPDELTVLGLPDAESYYAQLENVTTLYEDIVAIEGIGQRAFEAAHEPASALARDATIVVLKSGRVAVFEFSHVVPVEAHAFAASVMGRL